MRSRTTIRLLAALLCLPLFSVQAAETFGDATSGLERRDGLVETWVDEPGGRVLLALAPTATDGLGRFIFQAYLRRGVGSNPLGLDRTYGGNSQIVAFRRVGTQVVVEAENWRYQAIDGSPGEIRAVRDSFAGSVLWATPVVATAEDGRVLIDLSGFLKRDVVGVAGRIRARGQGSFSLDAKRSFVETGDVLVFPDNLEFEATLTFAGNDPGDELRQTAPEPQAVSVIQHQSLVRLPEPGFEMRAADPRVGAINHVVFDYATPLADPLVTRFVRRHRLEKVDPTAARSPAKEPIVFYLDPGAPEPIRSALLDGARWWATAFERAGFIDGYRVELLPADAHPLDVRYNVITWVHRATRGWSYGASVTDPRTGEIIKGFVLLGSQRVRQDRLIFEGLAGTAKTGSGAPDDPLELALARIRQLSAHEVGHTIGIQHNFAASSADRASVMDYPAPWIRIGADGGLDFSQAYDSGLGAWDEFTIDWMYRPFAPGLDPAQALDAMIGAATPAERLFVTDAHGRGAGTAHPNAAVWDNGADPVAALEEAMAVRALALADFGDDRLPVGRAAGQLQRVLVPIYLFHRYQVAAAGKVLGGADYAYRVAGDGGQLVRWVDGDRQRGALAALLETVAPAALDLPEPVLAQLTPVSRGFSSEAVLDRELFESQTLPLFDPLLAASAASGLSISVLLHPARASRLVDQHRRDPALPGLEEVIEALTEQVFARPRGEADRLIEIRRVVQRAVVDGLISLAGSEAASVVAAARAEAALVALAGELESTRPRTDQDRFEGRLAARIEAFLAGDLAAPEGTTPVPPGSPIGAAESCWHCEAPLP
ncbi:MAG: zinc-dependent metalloprotease [Pseudomonadota bacterium]